MVSCYHVFMAKLRLKPGPGLVKCEHCEAYVKDTVRAKNSHIGYHHKDVAAELFHVPVVLNIRCEVCKEMVANSKNVLGRHLRKHHQMEYIDYVVMTEHNGVRPTCECGCGVITAFRKGGRFDRFASKSCAASGQRNPMSKANQPVSPNLGKKRTSDMIQRYKAAAQARWDAPEGDPRREQFKSEEYRQTQSETQNLLYATTNHAEKVSKGFQRFLNEDPRAPAYRQAACDRAIDMMERGIISPYGRFKAEWVFNVFTSQMEYLHSGWEQEFLTRCVEGNTPVTKKHSIRIRYIASDNVERTYVPDFVTLDGTRVIHEVKGQEDDDDLLKYKAALAWCQANDWTFVVHGEEEFR